MTSISAASNVALSAALVYVVSGTARTYPHGLFTSRVTTPRCSALPPPKANAASPLRASPTSAESRLASAGLTGRSLTGRTGYRQSMTILPVFALSRIR